ncbi:MAG TPA: DUF6390 family protein [Candidatus Methanoperedens sp.]|nr:DUF6390 family protein [Candidatus Methanoperedens sp.]
MDKKALQLTARFSLPPNSMGYCGDNTASSKLINCVIKGECVDIEAELKNFIVLNPYLNTLTKITNKDKYSYPLQEAYWLGNSELKKAQISHYSILLENFKKQGVPDWLLSELKEKIPNTFIPFHLFQVLHVGVGKASGSVPYNLETINNCMVRWGQVKKISKTKLTVSLNSLEEIDKKFKLKLTTASFAYHPGFLPDIKIGDTVAVHWLQVVKILTPAEIKNLTYWTQLTLNTI